MLKKCTFAPSFSIEYGLDRITVVILKFGNGLLRHQLCGGDVAAGFGKAICVAIFTCIWFFPRRDAAHRLAVRRVVVGSVRKNRTFYCFRYFGVHWR